MKKILMLLMPVVLLASCTDKKAALQKEVQTYLDSYTKTYQQLYTDAQKADWILNTHIVDGDTMANHNSQVANGALSDFTGSNENIDKAKKYLNQKDLLTTLQVRQLQYILFWAGNNPEVAKDIVKQRIKEQNDAVETLYGHRFTIDGDTVTPNDIQKILSTSNNLDERLKAWTSAKEVGKDLKPHLVKLRDLRNQSVTPLSYHDFFSYQAFEYGMTGEEVVSYCDTMIRTVWPLYRELHTWARYTLAAKYHQPVPDFIPAHWLPNRWGQDWTALVDVKGLNIDDSLAKRGPEWIAKQGEEFYKSIGFGELPKTFWEKSSLYPAPKDSNWTKNTHASAWHIDLDNDVRSLQSIEANSEWWETCLHELGHIYYYLTYTTPEVPVILRQGANRAYHEAFGTMMGLASMQQPFLEGRGLIPQGVKSDTMGKLLQEALNYIVHIPWGAGTMTHFEYDLYSKNIPADQFNKDWWDYVKKYQGIIPPNERGEEYCDAATKTHIIDDPAQYYDYSMSNILLFQVHDYIAKNILHQDPHFTNYWGNKGVGDFLKQIMSSGATMDWRDNLKKNLGTGMSAQPMMDYFKPLYDYLVKANAGRKCTLPESI